MTGSRHLVVLRFSAMGDVALALPVIRAALTAHPELHITVVTRPLFARFFSCIRLDEAALKRLRILPAELAGDHSGWTGLWKLSRMIVRLGPDTVIDLHDHLRTQVLRKFLWLSGIRTIVFEKGRRAKRAATGPSRGNHRIPLAHTSERYRRAFMKAGVRFESLDGPHVEAARPKGHDEIFQPQLRRIGIAPFAAHATKQWPLGNFQAVIRELRKDPDIRIVLFGGRADQEALEQVSQNNPQVWNIAGKFTLEQELGILSELDVMLSVDSSNMHMAGLCRIPVVSIWGGTHTITGFGPATNGKNRILEVSLDELPCRPCSVFGKSVCARGDFACLTRISPSSVTDAILGILKSP